MSERYQILEEINQGGVGIVLKAWDTKLQRHVAIKRFISPEQAAAASTADKTGDLLQEASTLSSLQHPNIVSVYDVEAEGPHGPQVIMEYLNGQDLENSVAKAALTLEDFYMVAGQTLDALGNAHRMNLLHRDIKPSNIQVTWLANGKFVSKFVDFGLAKFFEKPVKQTVRSDGTVMGSIFYMAPEQFHRQPLDQRSDIYSLGCVFYYALTMHRPFTGATVQDVISAHLYSRPKAMKEYRPNAPADLALWVDWLMSREPANRPANAETAMNALRQIMQGERPTGIPGFAPATQPTSVTAGTRATTRATAAPSPSARSTRVSATAAPAATLTTVESAAEPAPVTVVSDSGGGVRASSYRRRKKLAWYKTPTGRIGAAAAVLALMGIGAAVSFSANNKPYATHARASKPAVSESAQMAATSQTQIAIAQSSPLSTASTTTRNVGESLPRTGLAAWFRAASGVMKDGERSVAVLNDTVVEWYDQEPAMGTTILQGGTGEGAPTRGEMASAGLMRRTPVLSLNGNQWMTTKDKDGLMAALKGNFTVLAVVRQGGTSGTLVSGHDRAGCAWSLGFGDDGYVSLPSDPRRGGARVPGCDKNFCIVSMTVDYDVKSAQRAVINPAHERNGSVFPVTALARPVTSLHVGGGVAGERWQGDVAEVMVYGVALADKELREAEDFLRKKYFGADGAAVTYVK